MVESLREKLEKKGWSKEEIDKTLRILEKAEESKRPALAMLDKLVYWVALLLAIGGNLIISVVLIPLLLTIQSAVALYFIIFILAIAFGLLFSLLLGDIGSISRQRLVVAGVFIPVVAIINIFIVVYISNFISQRFEEFTLHNPYLVSIIYVASFSLPYIIQKIKRR
jgi:hypothetical protein